MKLSQFFNSKKLIKEQKEKLEQQEKELIEEAYNEGLFEISLQSFFKELNNVYDTSLFEIGVTEVAIEQKAPAAFSKTLSEAVNWLKTQKNKELRIGILSPIYIPFETEPKFSDNSTLLENVYFGSGINRLGQRTIYIKPSSDTKLLLNIHPTSPLLKNEKIGQAILNAVKKKERKANMTKHLKPVTKIEELDK